MEFQTSTKMYEMKLTGVNFLSTSPGAEFQRLSSAIRELRAWNPDFYTRFLQEAFLAPGVILKTADHAVNRNVRVQTNL